MSRNTGPHPLCIGKCQEFQVKRLGLSKRYELGQKLCQMCNQWIYYDGVWCPCCHKRLRTKPKCKRRTDLPRI